MKQKYRTSMDRLILLNPGPVNITDRVRQALMKPDLCHREPECSELVQSIRNKLAQAFGVEQDFSAVLVTGSGTAALEMAVASCVTEGQSLLVLRNGVYGERIAHMAEAHGLPRVTVDYEWGQPPKIQDIERALDAHPEIQTVAMVHHETTTGLLNPIHEIGELVKTRGKSMLVDAISSLAGDAIDFERAHIDLCVGTANKCIQGLPGVSFVLVRNEELERLKDAPSRSVYFDLIKNHQAQLQGDTLFTPSVQIHYAFEAALEELIEETVPGRIERYRQAAQLLRQGFAEMGLEMMIDPDCRSNTLTALKLPDGVNYQALHDRLKKQGFVIYAGQGQLSQRIFRIANMGDIRDHEFRRFLEVMKSCLTSSSTV